MSGETQGALKWERLKEYCEKKGFVVYLTSSIYPFPLYFYVQKDGKTTEEFLRNCYSMNEVESVVDVCVKYMKYKGRETIADNKAEGE